MRKETQIVFPLGKFNCQKMKKLFQLVIVT